jgi:hypothetical protein
MQFMKKIFTRVGIVLLVLLFGVGAFLYWGVYDYGSRSGIVIRVSKKGALIKTIEGQLNLQTFGAVDRPNAMTETFDFSVERGRSDLFEALKEVSLSGERVRLEYKKRYLNFFWRGDTKYFVTDVVRTAKPATSNDNQRTNPYRENRIENL